MRESMNELFFGIATNTLWKQQQVRGLFAVYKKCCLLTEDRGALLHTNRTTHTHTLAQHTTESNPGVEKIVCRGVSHTLSLICDSHPVSL